MRFYDQIVCNKKNSLYEDLNGSITKNWVRIPVFDREYYQDGTLFRSFYEFLNSFFMRQKKLLKGDDKIRGNLF